MNTALESIIPANISLSACPQMEYPGTKESPTVTYNKRDRLLVIAGNSTLENAEDFYKPFVDEIYEDLHESRTATVEFNLEVFGPKTAKVLFKFFENLQYFKNRNRSAKIIWKFESGDESMRELGEAFSELFGLDFQLMGMIR